ncbi:MAG TPA: nucleotidyltransferase domain-containing protein [Polyangia bacterium]|jgi:predicted nucleotidyltransferase
MLDRVAGPDFTALREAAGRFGDARLIVLFGSVARGAAMPFSDADIGVAGVPFWRGLEIGAALAAALGREPHVVDLDETSEWLRFEVARDGVLLHAGAPDAWPRFQAEAAVRYFDLAPIIARCAEGVRRRLGHGEGGHG